MTKGPGDEGRPLVIGIGASAGGLTAFTKFFGAMPAENGMAFVLIQHLDPTHESLLVPLLAKQTGMKVVEASDGLSVAANCVYVIPPDATLEIRGGVLRLVRPAPPRDLRRPIDTFFLSLAQDQGENAVCIVLSGSGSDGSGGLRTVKEAGGLTLAQAEFDHHAMLGMPDSAAATGLVDLILPVEDMPARLLQHRAHLLAVAGQKDEQGLRSVAGDELRTITALLRGSVGQDFGHYKESTISRRVQRRMQVLQIETVAAYIDRLRQEKGEGEALFREMLIGVTQFFRDEGAFAALQAEVIPKLLARDASPAGVRVWVAGCATGEEVYSLAILFREAMAGMATPPVVQIFGSDIDDRAILRARTGRYRGPLAGVSPERLERWFRLVDSDYCVVKDVREMCVFSTHSLIRDPPFSKLDLVSCRNVMIYFDRALQDRAIRNFHYALMPGGFLFLGMSEGVTQNASLFAPVDKQHRIFARREVKSAGLPELQAGPTTGLRPERELPIRVDPVDRRARALVEKYSPAYLVVDSDQQVVRFSGGDVGQYLEPSAGVASLDLFTILRKSMRAGVRTAVRQSQGGKQVTETETFSLPSGDVSRQVMVVVEPLTGEAIGEGLSLVVFREREQSVQQTRVRKPRAGGVARSDGNAVSVLEQELEASRKSLRTTLDELETTTEEMKSSNEEFQSVNEELQASNEELETAKEEMQSVNEELRTVNSEIAEKNVQLQSLNSDLRNLLESTQIATMFLDNDLRIKSFTPGMMDLIHLRESDEGRPVTDIVSRLNYGGLETDARLVLRNLSVVEREVSIAETETRTDLVMRIRPYRSVTNVIEGVVITFVDITVRKALEETLKESERRLSAIINQAAAGVAETDLEGRFLLTNPLFCRISGWSRQELSTKRLLDLSHPEDLAENAALLEVLVRDKQGFEHDTRLIRPDGSAVWVHVSMSPTLDAAGNVRRVLGVLVDVTAHKSAEVQSETLLHELSHRVKNILATVQSIASQSALGASTIEGYRTAFMGRLMALAVTHNLLQSSEWHGVLLRDVATTELAPYQTDVTRWTIEGGDVLLDANAALALGMAIHELTTNAVKHGALSGPDGRIAISWTVFSHEQARRVRFVWQESGGPVVPAERGKGFGTRLITEGLALQLDGKITLDFRPDGVLCSIEFPLVEGERR